MRNVAYIFSALVIGLLLAAAPASATLITFDFNALGDSNNNTKVQKYMNDVLALSHPGGTVTVTGSQAEKNYNAEDRVTGPVSGNKVNSETLGSSDLGVHHTGNLDAFLVNIESSDRIVLNFSFPVYSAMFDLEIFPDGTCSRVNANCLPTMANWPDFTFKADGVTQFRTLAIEPGQSGTYAHAPESGPNLNEPSPQYLGVSGLWTFPAGVTKLEFVDWPRMIGIDNLVLNDGPPQDPPTNPPVVPEPGSLVLLGGGIAAAGLRRRRRQARA